MFYLNIFLLSFLMLFQCKLARSDIPDLTILSGSESRQGIVKLGWSANAGASQRFELQQDMDPAFNSPTTVYSGNEWGTFISGLNNGTYHYRIRTENGPWSEIQTVVIEHHSLTLAFVLMMLGAFVFLLTLGLILKGAKNLKPNQKPN